MINLSKKVADNPNLNYVVEIKLAGKVQNPSVIVGSRQLFWTLVWYNHYLAVRIRARNFYRLAILIVLVKTCEEETKERYFFCNNYCIYSNKQCWCYDTPATIRQVKVSNWYFKIFFFSYLWNFYTIFSCYFNFLWDYFLNKSV